MHAGVRRLDRAAVAAGLSFDYNALLAKAVSAPPRNEAMLVPVSFAAAPNSALLQGEYRIEGVYLGTPCVVGKNGVERVIELDLDAGERAEMQGSAKLLREMREGLSEEDAA